MKIGRKLYYIKQTGQPILLTEEQNSQFAVETTVEQDFLTYRELMGRNPEMVGVLQLEYGQYRGDFEKASSFRVNVETNAVEFELPEQFQSHEATIRMLQTEKDRLSTENADLKMKQVKLEESLTNAQLALVEIFEAMNPVEETESDIPESPSESPEQWVPDKIYPQGAKVIHNEVIWESLAAENTTEPGTDSNFWIEMK